MRLWHTELIKVLPREQLVAQWRELSAIAGAVQKNGSPNHLLVNFVLNYDWNHFVSYAYYVRKEMTNRGYRTMNSVWDKICSLADNKENILPLDEVYKEKMNKQYFVICHFNLLEKYICGGIDDETWNNIENQYCDYMTRGL